jgi:hypothetical protein
MHIRLPFFFLLFLMLLACPLPTGSEDPASSSSTEPSPDLPPDTPTTTASDSTSASVPDATGATTEGATTDTTTPDTETHESGTTGASTCGNAVIDLGENCDLGAEDNSDVGYCKTDCTLAFCGDGKLWIGVEDCDQGPGGNSGNYGGCTPDCTFSDFCGDGELHPSEICDNGIANGTSDHEEGYVACSASCDLEAYRIFITSEPFPGALGGITGADLRCQNLADDAGWIDTQQVRAWLSDSDESPLTRFVGVDPDRPYALVNGKRVADNLADLIASGPGDGVTLDELGAAHTDVRVWTNTSVTGDVFSKSDNCANWVSDSSQFLGWAGINAVPKLPADQWKNWSDLKWWTGQAFRECNLANRLYCLEI